MCCHVLPGSDTAYTVMQCKSSNACIKQDACICSSKHSSNAASARFNSVCILQLHVVFYLIWTLELLSFGSYTTATVVSTLVRTVVMHARTVSTSTDGCVPTHDLL
jgi:hypothetical protein